MARLGSKIRAVTLSLYTIACGNDGGLVDGGFDGPAVDVSSVDVVGSDVVSDAIVDGGFNPTCTGTGGVSGCGMPQSIIRTVIKLGDGMPDVSGNIILTLAHLRFGDGTTGGEPHTWAVKKGVTLGATTPVEIDFDMCSGSVMWSEENCEFNLWGFIDVNLNNLFDANEPAGRSIVNVSCHTSGAQCFGIVFDCTAGPTCVAVNASPTCKCAVNGCNSGIKHCN